MNTQKKTAIPRDKLGGLIYLEPPTQQPTRYELIKYATWRMRLYQEMESLSYEDLMNKSIKSADQIFPKLCQTAEQRQFYKDIFQQMTSTIEQDVVSYFTCLMLYSRELKNNDTFVKNQRTILAIRLKNMKYSSSKMALLKNIINILANIPLSEMTISKEQFQKYEDRILGQHQSDSDKKRKQQYRDQTTYIKVPFQYAQAGLKKRRSYIMKGYVYADIQTASEVVKSLYLNYIKERVLKTRIKTQKLLENDIENQLKPFMDKAISSVSKSTIEQTQLNSQFKLNLKNIDAVQKKYFPPCMLHLNKKLKQNNHLKHQGRRQLWLFFKGCGMEVQDNKQYFHKYLSLSVSNSELKAHMYNIQHAYGLVGKKEVERPKICRTIITNPEPKKDEHHGCPFAHWNRQNLANFLNANYSLTEEQLNKILNQKQNKSFMVACGRLFQENFKPQTGQLPQQITAQLGKSPHQYFIAGMEATHWINTKTLRPMKNKPIKMEEPSLEF